MPNTRLQKYLSLNQNPSLAMLFEFERIQKEIDALKQEFSQGIEQKILNNPKMMVAILQNVMSEIHAMKKGDDGYTPEKGKDYFTEQELGEIIDYLQKQIAAPIEDMAMSKEKIMNYCKSEMAKMMKDCDKMMDEHKEKMAEMDNKMSELHDGKDSDEQMIMDNVMEKVQKPIIEKMMPLVLKQLPEAEELQPEQLAAKINTMNEIINLKAINGLQKELEILRANIRNVKSIKSGGGGGGMGAPQHEVHTITPSTTTITLNNSVAANGNAVFGARVQGQTLDLGVHYSISSSVVTLLFTPSGGQTKFSISYIRG